jgi:hypothetical protein
VGLADDGRSWGERNSRRCRSARQRRRKKREPMPRRRPWSAGRVERQAVGHGGRWHWRYGVGPLSGFSSEPLLDACPGLKINGRRPVGGNRAIPARLSELGPQDHGRLRGVSRYERRDPSMRLRNYRPHPRFRTCRLFPASPAAPPCGKSRLATPSLPSLSAVSALNGTPPAAPPGWPPPVAAQNAAAALFQRRIPLEPGIDRISVELRGR